MAYYPVPKVACTSVKDFCYQVSSGERFKVFKSGGKVIHVHNHDPEYQSIEFRYVEHENYTGSTRIAVIRDPAKRILSAFSNRVLHHKELSESRIDMKLAELLGVGPDPDLNTFVQKLEEYRFLQRSIRHHTEPLTSYLGHDLGYYHHVFRIEETGEMEDLINRTCGTEARMGRDQKSHVKIELSELSQSSKGILYQYCSGDYALIKDYYRPPETLYEPR